MEGRRELLKKSEKNDVVVSMNAQMSPDITPKISPFSTPQRYQRVPIPNEFIRKYTSLKSSGLSKSRLLEPASPSDEALEVDSANIVSGSKSPLRITPKVSPRVGVGTPKSPLSTQEKYKKDEEEVYKSVILQENRKSRKNFLVLLEWIVLISLIGLLFNSLTIHQLKDIFICGLELWKWCVLVIVMFCGRLVTGWFMTIVIYLLERKFLFRKKAIYFAYGLRTSVRVFLWLSFVLIAWILLVIHRNHRTKRTKKVLHYITMGIAGSLVGAATWLVKTILIKTLALSFHVQRFFDRIQESLFHQYVLQTLSEPPCMEMAESSSRSRNGGHLNLERRTKGDGVKEDVINMGKLHHMNREKVSGWTMKRLIKIVRRTNLSTISNAVNFGDDHDIGKQYEDITSEWEAKLAAVKIFHNIAKPGCKYIEEEDLLRFMKIDEVNEVFPLFEGAIETGRITKSAMQKWVVDAYQERKILALSLNDTKTAIEELNKVVSSIVLIEIVIVWNLMMGFLTTRILVFISSQLLLAVFMFGNSAKIVVEAIIFVFVMHPFDVGDRCVIDGVQMVVEEMNILTTIFLRYDNEKITYPNSVLATKPISNLNRSPEMSDSVEFSIDFSTTVDTIAALKTKIKLYVESKPEIWRPSHSVQLIDIVNVNNIKMALYVTHTINFQNIGEKATRKSDLVLELKKIFEDLGIKYDLLPQEVHIRYVDAPASASVPRL
ncbi:unnamed protein product [Amaranthus hypochondriacus]